MAACYAPEATFQDPVFRLAGRDVGDMWRMLTGPSAAIRVRYRLAGEDRADWVAEYLFAGRPVRNEIQTRVTFAPDGRIASQVDSFDFPRWAAQALGWKGRAFGRFGPFRRAVQRRSAERLARWQRRAAGGR